MSKPPRKPRKSTTRKPSDAQIQRARELLAATDLETFIDLMHTEMTGQPFDWQPCHLEIVAHFDDIYNGRKPRSVLTISPRAGKTHLACLWIAHCIGRHHDSNWILAGYSQEIAAKSSGIVQAILATPLFQRVFPGITVDPNANSRDKWQVLREGAIVTGEVRTGGPGGSLQGFGAGRRRVDKTFGGAIVLDDGVRMDDARSAVVKNQSWNFFKETLLSRTNGPNVPIVIIGQRIAPDDISGRCLAGELGTKWEELLIPVLNERDESFWEAQFPAAKYTIMREADPHGFWTLYMGQPRDPKGSVFQPHMLELLPVAPVLPGARFVRAWDLAATSAADGGRDHTVGMLIALHAKRVFILDVVRGRWDAGKVEQVILHTAQRDGIGVRISLPQDPGQAGKQQVRALTAMLRGYIVESAPVSGSKLQRAQIAASQANVGNMACVQASWTNALLDELRDFTEGARQDDQVDALASGVAALGDLNITPEELRKRLEEQRAKLATHAMHFMAPGQKDTPAHKQWLAELAAVDEQLNPEAAQRIHDANERADAERVERAAAQARADAEWEKGAPERAVLEAARRAAYDVRCDQMIADHAQRLEDARAQCAGAISQAAAEGFTIECHDGRVRMRGITSRAQIQGPSPRLTAAMRAADLPLRMVYTVGDSAPLPAYEPMRFTRPPVRVAKPKPRIPIPTAERVANSHYFESEEEV